MAKQIAKTPFVPKSLGITAFIGADKIDFKLEGPAKTAVRQTRVRGKLMLDGKPLSIGEYEFNSDGEPARLNITWGKETLRLGRRWDAAGDVSFFRSLEPATPGPRTAAELIAALALAKQS